MLKYNLIKITRETTLDNWMLRSRHPNKDEFHVIIVNSSNQKVCCQNAVVKKRLYPKKASKQASSPKLMSECGFYRCSPTCDTLSVVMYIFYKN